MRILTLPGDGIGPEITTATLDVLSHLTSTRDLTLDIEEDTVGLTSLATEGTTLPDRVLDRIPDVDGVILGPVSHYDYPPTDQGGINPSGALRTTFRLYSNLRPCRTRPGLAELSVLRDPMDLVIVRENTEGFYSDRTMVAGSGEFMPDEDSAFSLRKITARACREVALAAFSLARTRRRKVTAVHKANVLKLSDALFLREVRAVATDYPDVELEELIVDAAAAHLIRRPHDFDVLVTTNMFGDILSDEASELSGGLGLGGSLNVGAVTAVAQAQHGSAPDIQGLGVANPTSLILSAAMLLDWYGRRTGQTPYCAAATDIGTAVDAALDDPATRTHDLGGTLGTADFTAAVVRHLGNG
ncbi:isocitrate/isopropylmalate family dehydrogenase [Corynebacterium sp. USCH3]|uniref:isocitrate/isopropylmalate dehydrogenase family protein n=1 Tax=Corynebacterium sp. USCH3 TaxID=3024840 RepID=UPI0030ACEBE6